MHMAMWNISHNLAKMFIENFTRYQDGVSDAVNSATPRVVGN